MGRNRCVPEEYIYQNSAASIDPNNHGKFTHHRNPPSNGVLKFLSGHLPCQRYKKSRDLIQMGLAKEKVSDQFEAPKVYAWATRKKYVADRYLCLCLIENVKKFTNQRDKARRASRSRNGCFRGTKGLSITTLPLNQFLDKRYMSY